MKQYYFIELLHFCGISDNMCADIKPIIDSNQDWINQFNDFNVNPILVAIQNKNLENLKLLMSYQNIKNELFDKMIISSIEIDDDLEFLKIFNYLKTDSRINLMDFSHKGKPIGHYLARRSNEVLHYCIDNNIEIRKMDLKGNNLFVDLFENFDESKMTGLKEIAKKYGISNVLNDSYEGLDFFSYLADLGISQNNKNLIVDVLNDLNVESSQ